jgi:hypothetical protein
MTTERPHKHQHLYDVPVVILGLSDKAMRALENVGITSVGDCIDFFVRSYIENPRPIDEEHPNMDEMRERADSQDPLMHYAFIVFMFVEVEQKLKDHRYWSFVAAGLSENDTKS